MSFHRLLVAILSLTLSASAPALSHAQKKSPDDKKPAAKPAPKTEGKTDKKKPAKPDEKPPAEAAEEGDFTPADLAKLMDTDKNGQITDQEAKATVDGLVRQGNAKPANEKSERIQSALDKNNNGRVDLDEAQNFVAEARLQTAGGRVIREMFDKLDDDKNGAISKKEFAEIGRRFKQDKQQAQRLAGMFNTFDANRDGKITLPETALAAGKLGGRATDARPVEEKVDPVRARVQQQFAALDRDRDGKISPKEANANRQLKTQFKQIDADLDGFLTLEEVLEFTQAQAPPR
jgi:Ca2+-binding EF-hand superfamily protein